VIQTSTVLLFRPAIPVILVAEIDQAGNAILLPDLEEVTALGYPGGIHYLGT
jgi:hypothetical protein